MPRDDWAPQDVREALNSLSERQVHEVLGWMAAQHPETLLRAVQEIRKHHDVLRTLTTPRASQQA